MRKSAIFLASLCLFGSSLTISTNAQESALAASTVADIASEIRDAVNDTIQSLDMAVGNNLFRVRQHLELLLGRVDAISKDSIGLLFEELNETEQQVFADLRRQTRELQELERVTSDDLESLINNFSSSLATLPFANALPMVFRSRPLYVSRAALEQVEGVEISVSGALLSAEEPSLTIDGNPCTRTEVLETSLKFLCDKEYFGSSDAIEVVAAELSVYRRTGFWDGLLFRDPDLYRYELSITVIPSLMGRIVPFITIREVSIERSERSQGFPSATGHCAGTKRKEFGFSAQEGWFLDANSISVDCKSSKKSSCHGLRNVQARSFAVACTIEKQWDLRA